MIIKRVNNKKMELQNILDYIKEQTKDKHCHYIHQDILENNEKVGVEYIAKQKMNIKDVFIIRNGKDGIYLSHIYENPNTELNL